MNVIISIVLMLWFSFSGIKENPRDFDNALSDIARKFKEEIMDKEECENQKREANDLKNEIEDALLKDDEYNPDEITELKKLKKVAEALEGFIAAVGNCGNYIQSIETFNMANRLVGASVVSVIKDKYCVDIISVTIGDYVAYLGENNSTKNFTVTYKWKAPSGMSTGNGTMGLSKLSVRSIYDNRETQKQKKISIFAITCKEF